MISIMYSFRLRRVYPNVQFLFLSLKQKRRATSVHPILLSSFHHSQWNWSIFLLFFFFCHHLTYKTSSLSATELTKSKTAWYPCCDRLNNWRTECGSWKSQNELCHTDELMNCVTASVCSTVTLRLDVRPAPLHEEVPWNLVWWF